MQNELATNVQQSVSDFGEWFTANQSRLLTAVALVIIGILLAFLLRAIVVRIVRTIERVIPGFSYRTSFAGLAKDTTPAMNARLPLPILSNIAPPAGTMRAKM